MIKATLAAKGKEFEVESFLLNPLEGEVTASWTDKAAKLETHSNDRADFTGTFTPGEGTTADDLLAATVKVTGYKLTLDGNLQYTVKGLSLTQDDMGSLKSLANYLNDSSYLIKGNATKNVIESADKNDKLFGLDGDDTLIANGGNYVLDGGKGKDKMDGGAGNDTYIIDSVKDKIIEGKDGGTDVAKSSTSDVSIAKFANVEDIFLFGKADLDAKGNSGNNHIKGNDGDNHIWGGKGNDDLTGGKGEDTFHFAKGYKIDTITDFDATGKGQDHIDLSDFGKKLQFKNLDIEASGKNDVSIDFGKGDELVLEGVKLKHIDASDFLF